MDLSGTKIPTDVTIHHLLTHTSGIADDADEEANESYEALWVDRPNYSVTETADFLPQFVHKQPNFTPGKDCRYCNVGFILAGLAVESVAGRSYRDYVREAVPDVADVAEGWEPVADGGGIVTGWRQNIYSYPPIGSPDGGATHFGYGLEFEIRSNGTLRSFYKDGVITGASAIVRYYPEPDAALAVVANSEDGARDPVKAIDAIIAG